MSVPEEPQISNTVHRPGSSTVVQTGSIRDLHVHSSSLPDHRDPKLVLLGVMVLAAALALNVLLIFVGLFALIGNVGPWRGVVAGGAVAAVVAGFLVGNLFRTVRDLMGRRHHAWRQDAFAGQSSLWLSLLAPVLVVGDLEAWEGWWWVPAVVVGTMATASITAAALTCERGVRRRWGLGVTAGVGAALWFGPMLVLMWGSDAQLSGKAVGTLVLVLGMVVPVLAVVAMPAVCGGVVLRAWALGVVLASARVWAAMSARLGPLFPPPIQLVVWPVCAVVVALVVSGMLRNP